MSMKATLLSIVLGLSVALMTLAGFRLKEATDIWTEANLQLDRIPVAQTLYEAAGHITAERLEMFAIVSSSKRLRAKHLPPVEKALLETDTALKKALEDVSGSINTQPLLAALDDYRKIRAKVLEAATQSAMVRDQALGREWLNAAGGTEELLRKAARNLIGDQGAINKLLDETQTVSDALSMEVANIGGLLAAKSYFNSNAAGELASSNAIYKLAAGRINNLAGSIENANLETANLSLQRALLETYAKRRDTIVDVGSNGGEFPEYAKYSKWFELSEQVFRQISAFRSGTFEVLAERKRDMATNARNLVLIALSFIALAVLSVVISILVLRAKVLKPLSRAVQAISRLAEGETEISFDGLSRRHEIGR
jgi:hypothetical protein